MPVKTALGRNQMIYEKKKNNKHKKYKKCTVHVVLHDADDFSGRHDYTGQGDGSC